MKALIIMPTYNERENLPNLLASIFRAAPNMHVLVVDDNSPDGTGAIADELAQQNPRMRVLHRQGKLGLGTAYIAGFTYGLAAGYDFMLEMDADFSHDPQMLPALLHAAEDAHLVVGSRYIPGGSTPNWSALRRFISGGGNVFARLMLGIPVHDCTSGFRCYHRDALAAIDLQAIHSEGYAFQIELVYNVLQAGMRIREVPITFLDRQVGKSKMSRRIFIEAFRFVLKTLLQKGPIAPYHATVVTIDPDETMRMPRVQG